MSIEVYKFESYDFNLIVYAGKITSDEMHVFYSSLSDWVKDAGPAWITYIDERADLSELRLEDFGALRRILLPRIHKLIQRDAGFCSIIVCNSQQSAAIAEYWRDFIGRDRAEPYYPIFFADLKGACEWLGQPPPAYDAVLAALDAARAEGADPDPPRGPAPPPAAG